MSSTAPVEPITSLVRRPMAYDDYVSLPDRVRAEWVDGEAVMAPSPSYRHQQVARRIANLLEIALPELVVVEAVTVHVLGSRARIPDVVVIESEPRGSHITETPVLVVEVLSPATRSEDTVRKSTEYLAAGIAQYWIVDPEQGTLEIFQSATAGWDVLASLDVDAPEAVVPVLDHGSVRVHLDEVLSQPRPTGDGQ